MKSRIIWLVVVVAALAGFYYATIRPTLTPAQPGLNRRLSDVYRPPEIPPPQLPQPTIEMPALPLPLPAAVVPPPGDPGEQTTRRDPRRPLQLEVPIQDGKTIDFSFGAPHIRTQAEDQAALDKALKEMTEATKDIRFGPTEKK